MKPGRILTHILIFTALIAFGEGANDRQLIYFDGHTHTTHSDGSGSIGDIKHVAKARNLSAVFVTNHATQIEDTAEWDDIVNQCEKLSDNDFLLIPSFEITGSEGKFGRDHVLAWGVKSPFVGHPSEAATPEKVWPSPTNPFGTGPVYPQNIRKWTDWIHRNGGIAIHAHPTGTTQLSYNADFIEVINLSHMKDIVHFAKMIGLSDNDARQIGMQFNNFAIYGSKFLQMPIDMPNPESPGNTLKVPFKRHFFCPLCRSTKVPVEANGWEHPQRRNCWTWARRRQRL